MGPIRGMRRKRKQEKKANAAAAAALLASSGKEPCDWWDDFSRRITGPLLSSPVGKNTFESVFKISRRTFNYICSLVKDDLMAKPSNFACTDGRVLSVDDQVAVALRRLSSGDSLLIVGQSFRMNPSTVSQVTWRFVEAMEERGMHHLRWPNTREEMEVIKSGFEKVRGLPNCCGAIDTTHIIMCLPSDPSNNVWIDHEKKHSMVVQVVVDPDMRFRDIVTGWPGSTNEFLILQNSGLFKLCERDMRLNNKKMDLSEGSELREYIIGDASYPLLPWLLTPYQGNHLTELEAEFNRRHVATRMVAQRALARLKEMWRFLQGEMWRPDKHKLPRIILVCCLLHNIIIDMEDEVQEDLPLSHQHDVSYRQQYCRVVDKNARLEREKLTQYLSGDRLPP